MTILERRVERRVLRDTQNPYELPITEFMNTFRVSPELAMDLTNDISIILKNVILLLVFIGTNRMSYMKTKHNI